MTFKIIVTETAKQDLREIAFYITDKSKDTSLAKKFVNELREECKRLENYPDSGSLPKNRLLLSAGFRFIVYKDYLIFYVTDNSTNKVYILSIFNAKKDYIRVMRRFL